MHGAASLGLPLSNVTTLYVVIGESCQFGEIRSSKCLGGAAIPNGCQLIVAALGLDELKPSTQEHRCTLFQPTGVVISLARR